jgi:hypothetical protein
VRAELKLFLWLTLGFFLCVPTGTFTHECGHYLALRMMGCPAVISYNFTTWNCDLSPGQEMVAAFAGPLVTMLTATSGFILLMLGPKYPLNEERLSTGQWILALAALFWTRPLLNMCGWILQTVTRGSFMNQSDELKLSHLLGLPAWSLPLLTAAIGLAVTVLIFFRVIPARSRLIFLLAGLCGGMLGILTWMKWLGPVLLPAAD